MKGEGGEGDWDNYHRIYRSDSFGGERVEKNLRLRCNFK